MIILNEKQREQIELIRQKEIKKGTQYQGTVRVQHGCIMWELNTTTGKIRASEIELVATLVNKRVTYRKKLLLKPDCLHVQAVNKMNAERKFKKMIEKLLTHEK